MVDKVWLPQRWDVGLWDQALWDGQLGFNTQIGSIVVTAKTVNFGYGHVLSAQKAAIVVNGAATGLYAGISMAAGKGSIVVAPATAGAVFTIRKKMLCDQGMILVNGEAAGQVTLTAFRQPGPLNFGIQCVVVPMRW